MLPQEIWQSVWQLPGSFVVQHNLPAVQTYEQFFSCTPYCERTGTPPPGPGNYESHQAPMAYFALAIFDFMFQGIRIEERLLVLRFIGASTALFMTIFGWVLFLRRLNLPERSLQLGIFLIGCSPMYWATIAHVANDWLAVGLTSLLLSAMLLPARSASRCFEMSLIVLLGALTKAYFLPLLVLLIPEFQMLPSLRPFQKTIVGCAVLLVLAWYGENLVTGNIVGLQELNGRPSVGDLATVAGQLDWRKALSALLLGALWTGNSSFITFSTTILWLQAAWLVMGSIAFYRFYREFYVSPFVLVFFLELMGSIVLSNWFTEGKAVGTSPWYAQPLYICTLFVCSAAACLLPTIYKQVGILLHCVIVVFTIPLKYVLWYTAMSRGKVTLRILMDMDWVEVARRSELVFGHPYWLLCGVLMAATSLTVLQAWMLLTTQVPTGNIAIGDFRTFRATFKKLGVSVFLL